MGECRYCGTDLGDGTAEWCDAQCELEDINYNLQRENESLKKQISTWKETNGLNIENGNRAWADLRAKLEQQESYAELGRLVTESRDGICNITNYSEKWSACRRCRELKICQKRAELLVEP
jgi:hypothetical protein